MAVGMALRSGISPRAENKYPAGSDRRRQSAECFETNRLPRHQCFWSLRDVGCGPGYVSIAAAERGAIPIGLDFSAEMIAIAKKMSPKIEFCQGDAQGLSFPGATFDRVIANFALLHLAQPQRAMAEAHRV